MNNYYVYVFLDSSKPGTFYYENLSFEFEPFYIGKGKSDRIVNSLYDKGTFKYHKIQNLKKRGFEVITRKIYENLNNMESLEVEKLLISIIGRRDMGKGPLVNLTDGGDGRLTSPHSEETKLKISLTKKSQNLHIPHTETTKEKLRKINQGEDNPMYGRHHTDEIKESHSLKVSGLNHPMYGKKHSEETLKIIREKRNASVNQEEMSKKSAELNSKKVLQFSLDGEFLNEFNSIKEASLNLGISESLIGKTCRGQIKNPRKFIFKFKDMDSNVLTNSFEIKIGDFYSGKKLIKRNKTSAIVESQMGLETLRKVNHPDIWKKKSI
jgi:group I intron endonuclease